MDTHSGTIERDYNFFWKKKDSYDYIVSHHLAFVMLPEQRVYEF